MRGIVVTIIGLMVMLLVGIIVVQSLVNSQEGNQRQNWSSAANTTWNNLIGNIWVAFTLIVICPIIIGAVAILAYLSFGRGGGP